jgi:hypothetical protein
MMNRYLRDIAKLISVIMVIPCAAMAEEFVVHAGSVGTNEIWKYQDAESASVNNTLIRINAASGDTVSFKRGRYAGQVYFEAPSPGGVPDVFVRSQSTIPSMLKAADSQVPLSLETGKNRSRNTDRYVSQSTEDSETIVSVTLTDVFTTPINFGSTETNQVRGQIVPFVGEREQITLEGLNSTTVFDVTYSIDADDRGAESSKVLSICERPGCIEVLTTGFENGVEVPVLRSFQIPDGLPASEILKFENLQDAYGPSLAPIFNELVPESQELSVEFNNIINPLRQEQSNWLYQQSPNPDLDNDGDSDHIVLVRGENDQLQWMVLENDVSEKRKQDPTAIRLSLANILTDDGLRRGLLGEPYEGSAVEDRVASATVELNAVPYDEIVMYPLPDGTPGLQIYRNLTGFGQPNTYGRYRSLTFSQPQYVEFVTPGLSEDAVIRQLRAVDLNNDIRPDLVVVPDGSESFVYFNTGNPNGYFTSEPNVLPNSNFAVEGVGFRKPNPDVRYLVLRGTNPQTGDQQEVNYRFDEGERGMVEFEPSP